MNKYNSADLIRCLKIKHIYGLFRRNLSLPYKEENLETYYRKYFFKDILNKQISHYRFLYFPFAWSDTKEGYNFWLRMYQETLIMVRKHETFIHKKT